MSNDPGSRPSDREDKTSDTPGSDALPRTACVQTECRECSQKSAFLSSALGRPRAALLNFKTARDVSEHRRGRRNGRSNATGEFRERDLPDRNRKAVRFAPLASVPSSRIILRRSQKIEPVITPHPKIGFSTKSAHLAQRCAMHECWSCDLVATVEAESLCSPATPLHRS